MKLRKKQAYFNSVPDGTPKRRKGPALFRIFYFLLIILVIAFISFYFIKNSVLFVYGTGIITPKKYFVQVTRPCEIINYLVKENQKIKIGTPLVKVHYLPIQKDPTIEFNLTKEIKAYKKELNQKNIEMQEIALFKSIRKEKNSDNTILSKDHKEYYEAKNEMDRLKLKIKLLEAQKLQFLDKNTDDEDISGKFKILDSKHNGNIFRITKDNFEYADKGDNLIIIESPKKIIVDAYFKPEYQKYINTGQEAVLEFADGGTAKGRIQRVYSHSYFFGEKGSTPNKDIIVEIIPKTKLQSDIWSKNKGSRIRVRLQRSKYNFIQRFYNILKDII